MRLVKLRVSTNTGKSSFTFSGSKIWETVPVNLKGKIRVQSKTRWNLVSFKRKYNRVKFSIFLQNLTVVPSY